MCAQYDRINPRDNISPQRNGRRKIEERSGVIQETYPSLFTVFIESQQSTVSFSYSDLLTKEVELQLEPSGENLF